MSCAQRCARLSWVTSPPHHPIPPTILSLNLSLILILNPSLIPNLTLSLSLTLSLDLSLSPSLALTLSSLSGPYSREQE